MASVIGKSTIRIPQGWHLVSYIKQGYPSEITGVACFDHILGRVAPTCKHIYDRQKLLRFCHINSRTVVVTDNHLSLHVPSQVPCIIVHHGIAFLHGERDPDWRIRNIQLIVQQKRMFEVRNPRNTVIVSCSRFCSEEFERLYGRQYKRFRRFEVSHMSCMELYDPNPSVKTHRTLSRLPVVGGDWRLPHKGSEVMKRVREILKGEFEFAQMQVKPPEPFDARAFTGRKFGYYRRCDMMLCLSSHEGNSYFVLDGLYCNLPLVTTNVGLAQEIEGAVVLPWRQAMRDPEFVADAIRRAWQTAHPCEMRAQYDRKWSRKHYVQAMVKAIKTLTV